MQGRLQEIHAISRLHSTIFDQFGNVDGQVSSWRNDLSDLSLLFQCRLDSISHGISLIFRPEPTKFVFRLVRYPSKFCFSIVKSVLTGAMTTIIVPFLSTIKLPSTFRHLPPYSLILHGPHTSHAIALPDPVAFCPT
jgi:hypothetical protein